MNSFKQLVLTGATLLGFLPTAHSALIPTASGQGVLKVSEPVNGAIQFVSLASRNSTLVSEIDGITYTVRLSGLGQSIQGSIFARGHETETISTGGGGLEGAGRSTDAPNPGPRLLAVNTLISDGFDFLELEFSQGKLLTPACGVGIDSSHFGKTSFDAIRNQIDLFQSSELLATTPLNHPMSPLAESLANFRSAPNSSYIKRLNSLRIVQYQRADGFESALEFRKQNGGIYVYRIATTNWVQTKQTSVHLIAILPSDLSFDQIQVGTALDKSPFGDTPTLASRQYVRLEYKGSIFYLDQFMPRLNANPSDAMGGILANIVFVPITESQLSDYNRPHQQPTEQDLLNLLRHQCYLQAKVM